MPHNLGSKAMAFETVIKEAIEGLASAYSLGTIGVANGPVNSQNPEDDYD